MFPGTTLIRNLLVQPGIAAGVCLLQSFFVLGLLGLLGSDCMALPFTVGAPVPLDIERYDVGGRSYRRYQFRREDNQRPTVLFGATAFMANQISFDELTQQLTAIGDVRVTAGAQLLRGDHLEYSFTDRRGMLTNAQMQAEEIFLTGGKVEMREIEIVDRMGERSTHSFEIHDGSITTCGYAIPHYHLKSDFLRVVPTARVWAYSAAYRILGVPVFYLPYLTRSLRKEPFAYIFEVGHDSDKGFSLLNRFNFHYQDIIHPLLRGSAYLDFYSRQGVGVGGKWTYLRRPEAESYLYGYYIDQRNNLYENNLARADTKGSRGKFAFQHFQRFGDNWTLTAKGRRLSDPYFDDDYKFEEISRGFDPNDLESDRDAFVNLTYRRTNANIRAIYKDRLEKFNILPFQETARTPELVFDSKLRPIGDSRFYQQWRLSLGHYKSYQTTTPEYSARVIKPAPPGTELDIEQELSRINLKLDLNRPINLSSFTIIPFAGYQAVGYTNATRDTRLQTLRNHQLLEELNEDYDSRLIHVGSLGVGFNTRWEIPLDNPQQGIRRRMIFEPEVRLLTILPSQQLEESHPNSTIRRSTTGQSYLSTSQQLSRQDRPGFPWMDGSDAIRDEFAGLEIRLDSFLQTKRPNQSVKTVVSSSLSTALDLTETKDGEEPLATVLADLMITPVDWLQYSGFAEYSPEGSYLRALRNSMLWEITDRTDLEVAHSRYQFEPQAAKAEEELSVKLNFTVSERYVISLEERYDLDDSVSRYREIGVARDFHDWIFRLGVHQSQRESRDRNTGVYFRLTFKTPKAVQERLPGGDEDLSTRLF